MKKNIFRVLWLITFVIFILSFNSGFCATYYVKNSGDNNASGLSDESAWQTISKVNSTSFKPGDTILFKRGGVWREQLTVTSSGSEGKPITYSAYGSGNNPEINGADVITGWTQYSGDIYVASVSFEVKQLFVDGERQQIARWPNTGWANIDNDGYQFTNWLTCNDLTQPDDYWNGCNLVHRDALYSITVRKITDSDQSDKRIYWEGNHGTRKNWGFFIQGCFAELNTAGEWYYDSSGGKIYWQAPSGHTPDEYTIEGSTRDACIYSLSKSYINIENITFRYGDRGVDIHWALHNSVENCKFYQNNVYGLRGTCSDSGGYLDVVNNYFSKAGYRSIYISNGNDINVKNNKIVDNAGEGYPYYPDADGSFIMSALAVNSPDGGEISGNTITGSAYHGISISGADNYTIEKNRIEDCLKLMADGGAIYLTGTSSGADDFSNTVVRYNFVKNSIGYLGGTPYTDDSYLSAHGLYSDDYADDLEWYGNISVGNNGDGALLHNAPNNKWYNNTFYNNQTQFFLGGPGNDRNYVKNNIFYAVGSDQYTFTQSTDTEMGTNYYDYNCHYAPSNATPIRWRGGGSGFLSYNLSDWQSTYDQDAHSIFSDPLFVNETGKFSQPSDFKIESDSLCIDAGINVDLSRDFDGITIPYGDAPDIGAFEYTVGLNPPSGIKVELIKD